MMKYLTMLAHFFQGTYAKFGTSGNLIREITVSVLTAVAVAILVQLLAPAAPSPISEVRALTTTLLRTQHRADSIIATVHEWQLQHRIDSLQTVILKRDEQDSLRANAGLSDLDAMRKINSAIDADRHGSGQQTWPK